MTAPPVVTKDMWVVNLVEPWKGDSNSISATEFFESINEAAEMGHLSSKDKVRIDGLKLKGPAKLFYLAQPQLKAREISFGEFRTAFKEQFKDKHTDHYHYVRLQNASQEKNESPEAFLDCLRRLCQQTIRNSNNAVEQAVINQEADRRLLAAFINELIGLPGKQVRLQMPDNIDKALNMVTVATNAERKEETLVREDRGIFTVRGNRGGTSHNSGGYRSERPRGEVQWSRDRGAGSSYGAGPTQNPGRVDRTYSCRSDSWTSMGNKNQAPAIEGGATSGPKNDDDRCAPRPRGIRCFNCGLMRHISRDCLRGQGRGLNGIGRTKVTPPSYPK